MSKNESMKTFDLILVNESWCGNTVCECLFLQHVYLLDVNSCGSQKTAGSHVALRGNISAPVRVTDLVEVSKDATSLVVCTRK